MAIRRGPAEAAKLGCMNRWFVRSALTGVVVVGIGAVGARGQAPAAADPAQAQPAGDAPPTTIQVQSQLVLVPTSVELGKDTLYELQASQFVVEDNGVPQRVRLDEADDTARPLSLVVAVQCSRSAVAEFDKIRGLPTMIEAITGDAPAEVAIIQFGTGEELLAGFTHDLRTRDMALNKLKRYQIVRKNGKVSKVGIKVKQKVCGWSREHLLKALTA